MTLDEAIEAQTRNAEEIVRLERELADAKLLLGEWVKAANIARDLTFAPIASASEHFLGVKR